MKVRGMSCGSLESAGGHESASDAVFFEEAVEASKKERNW